MYVAFHYRVKTNVNTRVVNIDSKLWVTDEVVDKVWCDCSERSSFDDRFEALYLLSGTIDMDWFTKEEINYKELDDILCEIIRGYFSPYGRKTK